MIRRLLSFFREDDRDFPTREPRGRIHFDGERTTAELVRELRRQHEAKERAWLMGRRAK